MSPRILIGIVVALALGVVIEYASFFGGEEKATSATAVRGREAQRNEEQVPATGDLPSMPATGALPPPTAATGALPPVAEPALSSWLGTLGEDERTPFLTLAEARALESGAVVQLPLFGGTLWSRGRRIVWLDGRPYVEGDHPGDFEISSIEPSGVVLLVAGKPVHLTFSQEEPAAEAAPEVGHAH